ncbi:hypothetical protein [Streptomyces lydicus]|uniref:hypothetical protein n=1 Tax=Streptomyces lydicus TaxID=47763 RepID=UPI0037BD8F9A
MTGSSPPTAHTTATSRPRPTAPRGHGGAHFRKSSKNGYETHAQQPGRGCGAVFRDNKSDLSGATGAGRYGFNITNYGAPGCPVTIAADHTVTGGHGVANPGIPVD